LAAAISTGKRCPVLSLSVKDDENEKRLHGAALAGQPLIALDNVNGVLRGDFLAQLVTQPRLQVRRLGSTGNLEIANCATVLANGNNIEIEGDLVRRTLRSMLDPQMEDPTARKFKGDPFRTVLADRGKFVAAVLTVVRSHLVAGFPGQVPPLGSFEEWSRLVRGALVWLGRADPVETQEGLRATDPALGPLDVLIDAWVAELGNDKITAAPLTVKELIGYNLDGLEDALRSATNTRGMDTLNTVRVGKFLKRFDGRIRNGVKLQGVIDQHRKQQTWQLLGWEQFLAKRAEDAKVVSIETARKPSGARKASRKAAPEGGEPFF
jgi:putative DNA primase/helicase